MSNEEKLRLENLEKRIKGMFSILPLHDQKIIESKYGPIKDWTLDTIRNIETTGFNQVSYPCQ
ncbi:MAG: hypothetical protein PHN89_01855 [Candidatus Pacebacteria bacterium]|nr:hypothetical protein [Candidatus Paceibacterota bacterium]